MSFREDVKIRASDGFDYIYNGYTFLKINPKTGKGGSIATRKIRYELEKKMLSKPEDYIDMDKGSVFFDLYKKSLQHRLMPERSREAIEWMRNIAKSTRKSQNNVLQETTYANNFEIGKVYFHEYEATTANKLPYWDVYPVTVCVDRLLKDNRPLCINCHYLPYDLRGKLFDALYNTISDYRFDKKTKYEINYGFLKTFSEFSLVKPTLHSYKPEGMKSRLIEIHPMNWTQAMFLPLHQFRKSRKSSGISNVNAHTVWSHSRQKI